MNAIDLITYRARPGAEGIVIARTATSITDRQRADRWQQRLDPWLRASRSPGIAYLDFRPEAAFIRFPAAGGPGQGWQSALALVGQPAELTGTYALELAEPDGPAGQGAVPDGGPPGPRRAAIERRARSAAAATALGTLLAHALQGTRKVTMPETDHDIAEAALWGLITLLRMLGDTRPVSFLTCASGYNRTADIPGMLVSFRAGVPATLPPDPGFAALAADLAARFADDPARLRQLLTEHGLPATTDASGRISRLLTLPPRSQPENVNRGGTATVTTSPGGPTGHADPAAPAAPGVMCPICLGDIPDWNALDYWRWDGHAEEYARIDIPPGTTPAQQARFTYGAHVRCPASTDMSTVAHYLPARYGRFGDPVLLGFVGLSESGKTHLLASMIGEIGGLSDYGIEVTELDRAIHHDFLEKWVRPLFSDHKALPGTPDDDSTTLKDAFIIRQADGPERVVALFDVSGGDLARRDTTKEFLWIADGLFFVIDPDHITASKVGDETFSNVLDILSQRPKAEPASAAIVLNKADKARFEEPIARWVRAGTGTLDPTEFLRESADVYAYLEEHHAMALTRPYKACRKATLHVASPTGGAKEGVDKNSTYPRGVTPMRVLRPLVAMLAMTGILAGPQAEQIGV